MTSTLDDAALTCQGLTSIYRRNALAECDAVLVELPVSELEMALAALFTHSLRVGPTQNLFAGGQDGAAIALIVAFNSASQRLTSAGPDRRRGAGALPRADLMPLEQHLNSLRKALAPRPAGVVCLFYLAEECHLYCG